MNQEILKASENNIKIVVSPLRETGQSSWSNLKSFKCVSAL